MNNNIKLLFSSRSTLQNYLKRHEGNDVNKGNTSSSNPFDKGKISAVCYTVLNKQCIMNTASIIVRSHCDYICFILSEVSKIKVFAPAIIHISRLTQPDSV